MRSIPVTILAGSDLAPSTLPASGAGLHPLAAYKGATIRVGGRALLELLAERLAAAGGFGPLSVAGPARVVEPLGLEARVIDTDGSVGANLRAAIEAHVAAGGGPLAVIACDVLPSAGELAELRARYERDGARALWLPFVRVPEDPAELGAFAWKPVYRVVPSGAAEAVRILPGHLAVFDPAALRLPLLYRLFDASYRSRNRSVGVRRAALLRTVLLSLLAQDVRLLAALRLPSRTVTVVTSGLALARALRRGSIASVELERLVGRIFLRTHAPHPVGIGFPIVDQVSLAEDVDTEEEAGQLEREAEGGAGGARGAP